MLRFNHYHSKRRNRVWLLFSIVLMFFISLIALDVRGIVNNEIEELQTKFTTFSGRSGLYDDGRIISQNLTKDKSDYFVYGRNAFQSFVDGVFRNNIQTQKVKLFIKFKHLRQIHSDRERAIANKLNNSPNFVPCKVTDGTHQLKCKVRLKGLLSDHWSRARRFSLKVIVSDGFIHGLKSFSIQKPMTRQFPYDQTFHALANAMGSHSSNDQRFYSVEVNGQSWGIMNVEPDIDQTFIEASDLKRLGVFKISDQRDWFYKRMYGGLSGYYISDPRINLSLKGKEDQLLSALQMAEVYHRISEKLFMADGDIFSREMMIDNLVLGLAWGELHALFNENSRYTWNTYTKKLEPILTDQAVWKPIDKSFTIETKLPFEYKIMISGNPLTTNELTRSLSRVENILKEINPINYANGLKRKYFPNDRLFKYHPISTNIFFLRKNLSHVTEWLNSTVKNNIDRNKSALIDHLSDINEVVAVDAYDEKKLRIYNMTNLPGTLKYIKVAESIKKKDAISIPASSDKEIAFVEVPFDYKKENVKDIEVFIELGNISWRSKVRKHQIKNTATHAALKNPFCQIQYDYCELSGHIEFAKNAEFNLPVVVQSGTIIDISNGANLFFNSSLTLNGSIDDKILVQGDNTGGLVIVNKSDQISAIKNTVFSKLSAVDTYLHRFTGTINGYGGVFKLWGVSINECSGEDQLNLVHADIDLQSVKLYAARSDAFDCDFCKGEIRNIEFYSVGGDALDVSGSNIRVKSITAIDVTDKAVSVGERSSLNIENLILKEVSTGIAIKDGSKAVVDNIIAENIADDLMMTYIKKQMYTSPTKLDVSNIQLSGSIGGQVCVRQFGTELSYENILCAESTVDVNKLYDGRMKK